MDNPKFSEAKDRIKALFISDKPVSVAYSAGRDSSVLLGLTLQAAIDAKLEGASPYVLVTNGDTGVENPEVSNHVKMETVRILNYAKKHQIELHFEIAKPHLNASWAVQIISGRCLPSFPNTNSDCSVDLKVQPMTRLRRNALKSITASTGEEAITLVGTRFSESTHRQAKMTARKETHLEPTRNENGDLIYPVIADFETEDVWEWIGLVRSGLLQSYSDFDDLTRIYAAAGNTSCAVVSDAITEGMKKARGGCGARTGCITCVKVKTDKSLEGMIESDKNRYGYMEHANRLRNFLSNTQWDFSRRNWVGKRIAADGSVAIRPDTYSPEMCLDLLRYCLTIDIEEQEAAREAGLSAPRFELITLQGLIAIDALWSLQGMHKPFQAVHEYREIYEQGKRYPVPDIEPIARTPMPKTRHYQIDKEILNSIGDFYGLRDVLSEMHESEGCMGTRTLSNGITVLGVETETAFDVDIEGAVLAMEFELDRMMDIRNSCNSKLSTTRGYRWWVQMGIVSLAPQQLSIHDQILKRTTAKSLAGLTEMGVNVEELIAKSYAAAEPVLSVKETVPVQLALFAA